MAASPRRFFLIIWLLAGALLVSVALNVYCFAPRPGPLTAWSRDDNDAATDDWDDEDEDDDDDNPLTPSRATLADELRRTRLQLSRCQADHAAHVAPAKSAAQRHPHG